MISRSIRFPLIALFVCAMFASCSAPKDVTYFQDTDTNTIIELAATKQITVQPGDKLSIVVKSKEPAISNLFNLPVYTTRVGAEGATIADQVASYTVDNAGDIEFPVLGKLHIAGMTRSELAGYVKGELMGRNLVKDPTVIVDFLNSGIDVLGEVKRPGRFEINKDKLTILEAISMAGDLSLYGQRDNVKVLRQEDGKLKTYKVDLTNAATVASSPVYYLQQGDLIYVEPNQMQKRATTVNGNNLNNVSFWITVTSLLTSVATTLVVLIRN